LLGPFRWRRLHHNPPVSHWQHGIGLGFCSVASPGPRVHATHWWTSGMSPKAWPGGCACGGGNLDAQRHNRWCEIVCMRAALRDGRLYARAACLSYWGGSVVGARNTADMQLNVAEGGEGGCASVWTSPRHRLHRRATRSIRCKDRGGLPWAAAWVRSVRERWGGGASLFSLCLKTGIEGGALRAYASLTSYARIRGVATSWVQRARRACEPIGAVSRLRRHASCVRLSGPGTLHDWAEGVLVRGMYASVRQRGRAAPLRSVGSELGAGLDTQHCARCRARYQLLEFRRDT
jgi:hypothetical protein